MNGPDLAALIERLRRLQPPMPSVFFRRQAWKHFEHELDPLGEPLEHDFVHTAQRGDPSRWGGNARRE